MKVLIVANWKMNPATARDAKRLFEITRKAVERAKNVTLLIAPPVVYLREIVSGYKGKRIGFCAQSGHFEASGAFTGEISLAQLRGAKAIAALVGHAERRAAGETNDDTRKKVATALSLKMTPILCVGEQVRTRDGEYFNIIKEQLRTGLKDVSAAKITSIIVAYEPVWAIGGTMSMSARDMHEMAIFIRKSVVETHGQGGMGVKILYGGSIDETNAADMLHGGDVNGLLVGRASTDAIKFTTLLEAVQNI